ncbi:MAG: MOSC domain-containing protein [Acidimicrobiia bacterium]
MATIFLYPIKSIGGTTIDETHVGDEGITGDRQFGFLDLETGNLCNAKNPRKYGSMLACRAAYVDPPSPGRELPLLEVAFPDGTRARNVGTDLDEAMSGYLGRRVALVSSVPEGAKTEIVWMRSTGIAKESVYADAVEDEHGDHVATYEPRGTNTFFDLTPLHLVTTSTIRHLREIDPSAAFDARRYRPTMLIDTVAEGFVEDGWVGDEVRIGPAAVAGIRMSTPRCVMSTLAHAPDVPLDRGTLRTIARANTKDVPGFGRWACAGVYADVARHGPVRVGDPVHHRPAGPAPAGPVPTTRDRSNPT